MIHHMSIAAQNPQHVAQVLAEVVKGRAVPFPPHPGSHMVVALDEHGTLIEVYPFGSEILPGTEAESCQFAQNSHASRFTATHAAVSVPSSQTEIEQIGVREGWRVVRCNRDSIFDVMEFWVENSLMIEFLTPEMAQQYVSAVQNPEVMKLFLGEPAVAV
jgi:hypothetical protein